MSLALKAARDLLARVGWVGHKLEPFCVARAPGVRLNPLYGTESDFRPLWLAATWVQTLNAKHQELMRYSVRGACEVFGADFEQLELAHGADVQQWLQQPARTKDDVLSLFVEAIKRSKKATGERR